MKRAKCKERRREMRRPPGTGARNRRGNQRKAHRNQQHLNSADQQRALFKRLQHGIRIQTYLEKKRICQRVKLRISPRRDLKSLHGHVVLKRSRILDEQHRHIAHQNQRESADRAKRLFFFARHAVHSGHDLFQQKRQHGQRNGKRNAKAHERRAPRCRAALLDLRAERSQQRINQRADDQHRPLPAPVFLHALHSITP